MNDLFNYVIPNAAGIALAVWNTGYYFEDFATQMTNYLESIFKV